MILPYLCSGLFFCSSFFLVKTQDDLRVLSQRLLFSTIAATTTFIIYPLHYSFARPEISTPLFASLFHLLAAIDQPYNQFPSLHVAYCLIFWIALRNTINHKASLILLATCLGSVAISTLFTYQHHLLDVAGGLLLASASIHMIRPGRSEPHVAFYYAVAAGLLFILGVLVLQNWLALYLALSLACVSLAYHGRHHNFLHKKNGRHRFGTWLVYAPYLFGYYVTWCIVQYRERGKSACWKIADGLWIGRRLNSQQAQQLPKNCHVIDLCCELSETTCLRAHPYSHFPMLDLTLPETDMMKKVATRVISEQHKGNTIYLHCAMGYRRCKLLADYVLTHMGSDQQTP